MEKRNGKNFSLQHRAAVWIGRKAWFARMGPNVVHPINMWLWRLTGRSPSPRSLPQIVLTTTGRRSGLSRTVSVLYLRDGDGLVIVGSNWGQDMHPGWSANLLANPEATVLIAGTKRYVVARLATEEEQTALWPRLLELWPAWADYAEKTSRKFRVFILDFRG